jgi:hypothetical protein
MALTWLDCFLLANFFGAGSSVFIYLLVPDGTSIYFFQSSCPAAAAWVRIVAAGDAAIAFISIWAKLSKSSEVKVLAVWQIFVYNILHGGAYLHGNYYLHPIPATMVLTCWSLIICGTMAAFYWGLYHTPE